MHPTPVPHLPVPAGQWSAVHLGTVQDDPRHPDLSITEELLRTHLAVFGGTRNGKSKLFEHFGRELIEIGRGFAFIDPHSDTADDLLAYLASKYDDLGFLRNNIHYLNPTECLFSFDPFQYTPDPDDPWGNSDLRYCSWLHTKIKDMVNIIVRQQGETEDEKQKMVRLKRWLYNALHAVGVRQDERGTHLPLKDAFVLLNPAHPDHDALFERVEPFLSEQVHADFLKLRATRDPRKQEDWVESTINRLRDILSPIVERIFNLETPTIDFRDIIRRNGVILAALGKTPYFHEDEALAIAGLLIREISEAARTVKRTDRRQYYLFIDEAQSFLGEDLLRILKESAKYKLSLGLAVQGLDNLQKGEIDLVPAVLGQCGVRITFRQQHHEHAEFLAKSLCYPMLDFTELIHEVDRDADYDWYVASSESESIGETTSTQQGVTESRSEAHGHAHGASDSRQHSASLSENHSTSNGQNRQWRNSTGLSHTQGISSGTSRQESDSRSSGETHSTSRGSARGTAQSTSRNQGESRSDPHHATRHSGAGLTIGHSATQSEQQGTAQTASQGHSTATSESEQRSASEARSSQQGFAYGDTCSVSHGLGLSHGLALGEAHSHSRTVTRTTGHAVSTIQGRAQSRTKSQTRQLTPLHRTRPERQHTGRLLHATADQFTKYAAAIASLSRQHCLVAVAAFNRAVVLRVDDVLDPFEVRMTSAAWRHRAIARLKERIFEMHSYYFTGDHDSPPPLEIELPNERRSLDLTSLPVLAWHPERTPSPFPG